MSGRSCSVACAVFYARDPVPVEEPPQRPDPARTPVSPCDFAAGVPFDSTRGIHADLLTRPGACIKEPNPCESSKIQKVWEPI